MYISNRKHGFRIIREFQDGAMLIASRYGTQTKITPEQAKLYGYRRTPNPPQAYLRG